MLAATPQSSAHSAPADFPTHRTDVRPASQGEVDSAGLLRGQREVLIRHGDETYRLRHTRNDKLILTK